MKEITLYREDNCQYSTSEAKHDDVSGVYVQKENLTDLQAQNDELRAKIKHLESSIAEAMEAMIKEEQSLADIRAEAVTRAANAVVRHNEFGFCLHCLLIDHANKIKGAE